ncbi:MAG: hypothetical protein K2I67_00715, partial [Malacoplasma sp.]|nr:hypothetical protein [Malacoplasma sp.]
LSYISDVSTLTNNLKNLLSFWNFSTNEIDSAITLADKKSNLISELEQIKNSHNGDFSKLFNRKNQYIGLYKDTYNTNTQTEYGSYVIQLNQDDLSSITTLNTAIKAVTTVSSTGNGSSTETAMEDSKVIDVIMNLVIKAASDSNQQNQALTSILSNRRVDVYDTRLNTQLGAQWASNWK